MDFIIFMLWLYVNYLIDLYLLFVTVILLTLCYVVSQVWEKTADILPLTWSTVLRPLTMPSVAGLVKRLAKSYAIALSLPDCILFLTPFLFCFISWFISNYNQFWQWHVVMCLILHWTVCKHHPSATAKLLLLHEIIFLCRSLHNSITFYNVLMHRTFFIWNGNTELQH